MKMKRFLRLLRLRAQVRYWRHRALRAESSLESERCRNQTREDFFVSASVMGTRGMFGVAPRTGPARQAASAPVIERAPLAMTGADRLEFETLWLPDARAAGIDDNTALRDFMQEIAKRRIPLNDEPYSH